jgi:hypothetical protein
MKKRIILLLFVLFSGTLCAQKLYVWCPRDQKSVPRPGFLEKDTVDVVIFDGRLFTKNSKVECTAENTIAQINEFIRQTYPSCTMHFLTSDQYYKDPVKNRLTIKIGISAFHAAFGADVKVGIGNVGGNFSYGVIPEGKWNAITAFSVRIYDFRDNLDLKRTRDVYKIASKPNMGGYNTAKNILNDTYLQACQELIFFIDEALMK